MTHFDTHESAPSNNDYYSDVNNNSPNENDVIAPAQYFDKVVTVASQVITSQDYANADVPRGPMGAAAYASVVIIVYALPIVFFLGVYVFHRSSSKHAEKTEMDRQVEKFLEHTMLLQESLSRDNFKQLKRTLVPRVANSQAKELIERRPSCLALLDGFDLTAGEHLLGAARSVAALSDDDSTSWKSLPDDGRDEAINLQGVPVKNLKDVTRMTRIVEEDQSVAWAAQVSGDAGISSNNRRSVIRGNVDDDADYLLQPPSDDDEHRVWIPLPFMPKSVHYQQHPTASTHSHAKRSNHLSNYSNGSPEDNKTISQKTTLDGDTRRLRPTAIEYEDRWYEEMDGRPLLALKTVETTELHSLYISEVSSGSDTSSDSDSDHNDDAEKGTCRDDVDVSILMDEDEGDANSELTSLAWSDSDDDRDEHTEPL